VTKKPKDGAIQPSLADKFNKELFKSLAEKEAATKEYFNKQETKTAEAEPAADVSPDPVMPKKKIIKKKNSVSPKKPAAAPPAVNIVNKTIKAAPIGKRMARGRRDSVMPESVSPSPERKSNEPNRYTNSIADAMKKKISKA